ncbi:MAG: hypothetical protein NTX79_03705 [Candidatus Micrarchaeota archaeon]|nr:hypothetical protein [Candidatus Micrarchaeota archaeon]
MSLMPQMPDVFSKIKEQGLVPGDFVLIYVKPTTQIEDNLKNLAASFSKENRKEFLEAHQKEVNRRASNINSFDMRGPAKDGYRPVIAQIKNVDVVKKTVTFDVGGEWDISTTFKSSEISDIQKLSGKTVNIIMRDNSVIVGTMVYGFLPWLGHDKMVLWLPDSQKGTDVNINDIGRIDFSVLPGFSLTKTSKK